MLRRYYVKEHDQLEHCYYVSINEPLNQKQEEILSWLIGGTDKTLNQTSSFDELIEIGPRLNFETSYSSAAVAICHACGINSVDRVERSRRYPISILEHEGVDKAIFIHRNCDKMQEQEYVSPLEDLSISREFVAARTIPVIENGISAIDEEVERVGLGMDEWDQQFFYQLFADNLKRNPTDVEIFHFAQLISEHARHLLFNGSIILDGELLPYTLFDVVRRPLLHNQNNSLIAFHDNASAIKGFTATRTLPESLDQFGPYIKRSKLVHPTHKNETHNAPSGKAPFPGAATGVGGRVRDVWTIGRGGQNVAGSALYCVGNLHLPNYHIPGEDRTFVYPASNASPLNILIEASNGASDYHNKIGEPLYHGPGARSFGMRLPGGSRREWIKPIMDTGGVGELYDSNKTKGTPAKGHVIVMIGGPTFRIGIGGSTFSSQIQGSNTDEIDENAVQRGAPEMAVRLKRVIQACSEMEDNPIVSIFDQGAGGMSNVLSELVEPAGGTIDLTRANLGDQTLTSLEKWVSESQERAGLLIEEHRLSELVRLCDCEQCPIEILGTITDTGYIEVTDNHDSHPVVSLPIREILGNIPQKEFRFDRSSDYHLKAFELPKADIMEHLRNVFAQVSVGSKEFLTNKADRSVSGRVAQQQCCGVMQLPVSDVGIASHSFDEPYGVVSAAGEQPIKMLVDVKAGARMTVAELITNMLSARITDLTDIKLSCNWMWPAKMEGEGAKIHDAAVACTDLLSELGVAIDGGKDSLTQAANTEEGTVKAPGEMVLSGYVTIEDLNKVYTPDIKHPDTSELLWLDLGKGKHRLGGTALLQSYGVLGDEVADIDNTENLLGFIQSARELQRQEKILAYHDVSDGGVITTIIEMCASGDCGVAIHETDPKKLFSEEAGAVIECNALQMDEVYEIAEYYGVSSLIRHIATPENVSIKDDALLIVGNERISMYRALGMWRNTSFELEKQQMNPFLAHEDYMYPLRQPEYDVLETMEFPSIVSGKKPQAIVLRTPGTNSDEEMVEALTQAGFNVYNVPTQKIMSGDVTLRDFQFLVLPGGFSFSDVFGAGRGWAGMIRYNPHLFDEFNDFFMRPDTLSLGVCNGCQVMTSLGWITTGENDEVQMSENISGRFDSRWVPVKVLESNSVLFQGMNGVVFGIPVANREGRFNFKTSEARERFRKNSMNPLVYVNDNKVATTQYPFNPSTSPDGIAALSSQDGRHLAMMPHAERAFLKWQCHYLPECIKNEPGIYTPWFKLFTNARSFFM